MGVTWLLSILVVLLPASMAWSNYLGNSGEYCGVDCVYVIAKMYGRTVDGTLLNSPKYMPRGGSSLEDLSAAAKAIGLATAEPWHLSTLDIQQLPYAAILHVKGSLAKPVFNHWVVFAGWRGQRALVFDTNEGWLEWSATTLASRWDGDALVVPNTDLPLGNIRWPTHLAFITAACAGVVAICVRGVVAGWATMLVSSKFISWRTLTGMILVVGCGVGFSAAYAWYCPAGLWHDKELVRAMESLNEATFLSHINKQDLQAMMSSDTDPCVIIDARHGEDYAYEHIKGAISISPERVSSYSAEMLQGVPKSRQIVVYCQSVRCKFADTLAVKLDKLGFNRVAIYSGGWDDWAGRSVKRNG